MAYPAGYWAELVRSGSSSVLTPAGNGGSIWLRTSDGLPLEQETSNDGVNWVAVSDDTGEPDLLGNPLAASVAGNTLPLFRFRKSGEDWIPSAAGIRPAYSLFAAGESAHRFFTQAAAPDGNVVTLTIGDGGTGAVLNWPFTRNVSYGNIPGKLMASGVAAQLRQLLVYSGGLVNVNIQPPDRLSSAVPQNGHNLIQSVERFDPALVIRAGNISLELPGPDSSGIVFRDAGEPYAFNVGNGHGQAAFIAAYRALTPAQRAATTLTLTDELLDVRLASRLPVHGTGASKLTVIQPVRLASRLPVEGLGSVARLDIDYHSDTVRLASRLPVVGLGSSGLVIAQPVRLASRLPVEGLGSSRLITGNPVRLASRLPVQGLGSSALVTGNPVRLASRLPVVGIGNSQLVVGAQRISRLARLNEEWVEVSPVALARADRLLRQSIEENADGIVAEAEARTELQARVEGSIASAIETLTVQVRSLGFDADYNWLAGTKTTVTAAGRIAFLTSADYAAAAATRTHAGIAGAGALLVSRYQADGTDLLAAFLAVQAGQSLGVELAGGRRYVFLVDRTPLLPATAPADAVLIPVSYQSHEGGTGTLATGAGSYGLRFQRVDSASARWLVKTRVNDLVGGIGLYNNGEIVSLIATADRFAILSSESTLDGLVVPFAVQDGTVYIDRAMIADGSISHLKAATGFIENLVAIQGHIQQAWIEQGDIFNLTVGNVIQSQNFQAGRRGWRLLKDGSAEFDAAVIRGVLGADHIDAGSLDVRSALSAARATIAETLTATAIRALRIDATQITTGTLSAARINASALSVAHAAFANSATIAGSLSAAAIRALRINADQITAGTLSAARILLDGVTLRANAAGRLEVNTGGLPRVWTRLWSGRLRMNTPEPGAISWSEAKVYSDYDFIAFILESPAAASATIRSQDIGTDTSRLSGAGRALIPARHSKGSNGMNLWGAGRTIWAGRSGLHGSSDIGTLVEVWGVEI